VISFENIYDLGLKRLIDMLKHQLKTKGHGERSHHWILLDFTVLNIGKWRISVAKCGLRVLRPLDVGICTLRDEGCSTWSVGLLYGFET